MLFLVQLNPASNNTYSLYSATILTHTVACSHKFFSETNHCYSRNDVRSQLVPFSSIPRSCTWQSSNLQTLKIRMKLTQKATKINFFAVVIRGKRKFILAKKIFEPGHWHLNSKYLSLFLVVFIL